jgi:NDP-sugar pyrophosphorylase family protein
MFKPGDLFDLSHTQHAVLLDGCTFAWEALARIKDYLKANARSQLQNRCDGNAWIGKNVFIGEGTVVEDGAMIKGPAIIGRNCQIRHNAYLREHVVIGDECVVGNSCELKNVLLFDNCQVPHFNYVGDSILGNGAHLGAGVICSNLRLDQGEVTVRLPTETLKTGLRKFGAILGDRAEVGCNAVLNPGSLLGPRSLVMPAMAFGGVLPPGMIARVRQSVAMMARRD